MGIAGEQEVEEVEKSEVVREMEGYYADRAVRYDKSMGYTEPLFAERNRPFLDHVRAIVRDRDVLEVACGPGWWTLQLASAARSILGTDYNQAVLAEARKKTFPEGKVRFQQVDAYSMNGISGTFDASFSCDWWSHMPFARIPTHLEALHAKLVPGASVVIVEAPGGEARNDERDEEGNRIVTRGLPGDRHYRIIKNYLDREQYERLLAPYAKSIDYREIEFIGKKEKRGTRVCVHYMTR